MKTYVNKKKQIKWISLLTFIVGIFLANSANASVWWPEVKAVSPTLSIFQDFDDSSNFYYVPKSVKVARHLETGKLMVSHGLFFDRFEPKKSSTQYHMTLEPRLGGPQIDEALSELQSLYGSQVHLSPLPITSVTFSVTQRLEDNEQFQISTPFTVTVPEWTGNLHSFHQRFSVKMKGNMYRAEPAMSRFITNKAGNAFIGTMHYGFRGVRRVFDGHMKIDVHQFVDSLKTHLSASAYFTSIDIKTAIERIKDNQNVFIEVVRDDDYKSESWDALVQKLVQMVFIESPKLPEQLKGGTGGGSVLSFKMEYAKKTVNKVMTITLKEAIRGNYSGDIDLTGGAMQPELLDSRIKYLCDMWEKFDRKTDRCEIVCEPAIEYYDPSTKECQPAFGGGI